MVEPDWSELPSVMSLGREYLLLAEGAEPVELTTNLEKSAYIVRIDWSTESGNNDVISVENGSVTVQGPGTDYVVATLNGGGRTLTARCRVDVLDEEKQGDREIAATLPVTQVTTEIYKTDYTRFNVVLRLEQNVMATGVTAPNGDVLEGTGIMITGAEFVGSSNVKQDIRPYFALHVVDDRTLEIIPTVSLNDKTEIKPLHQKADAVDDTVSYRTLRHR